MNYLVDLNLKAIGIACGFIGKAQIGKGMWAMPDKMKEMMEIKIEHPRSGANCAWVPSPTAATLHAMHYHYICVKTHQRKLKKEYNFYMQDLLKPPVALQRNMTSNNIQDELDNNIQGILGYVVHWVNQGIGCSKVLDIKILDLWRIEQLSEFQVSI